MGGNLWRGWNKKRSGQKLTGSHMLKYVSLLKLIFS